MAAYIDVSAPTGMTLFATIRRRSDGLYWKDSTKTFSSATFTKADHAVSLNEGADHLLGTYASSAVSSGSTALDAECIVCIHDDTDSDDVVLPGAISRVVYRLGAETTFADLMTWLGSTPDALSSGKAPADVKLWLTGTPDALSSGKLPADVKLWLTGTPNALVSGRVDTTVGAMQNNVVTAAAVATDAIDADALAADAVTKIRTSVVGINASVWAVGTTTFTTGGTVGKLLLDQLDATISSRLASASYTAPPSAATISTQVLADIGTTYGTAFAHLNADVSDAVDAADAATAAVGALNDPTVGEIADAVCDEALAGHATAGTVGAALSTASGYSIPSATTIADAVLSRSVSNVEAAASTSSLCYLVLSQREASMSGTTLTVYQTDGTTVFDTRTFARETTSVKPVKSLT